MNLERKEIEILWTAHGMNRQSEWQRKKGITRAEFESVATSPEQVVQGDLNAFVAQSKFKDGLIRVPFVERGGTRKILTVYWTSKVSRYWQESEDKNETQI